MMMFDHSGGIYINEMADKLNFSPSYLSKLYKEGIDVKISKHRDIIRWLCLNDLAKKGKTKKEIAKEPGMTRDAIYKMLYRNSMRSR
ncbi:helix-turn-helix transcriptional regulator [candidate division KSB1 bacterium]